MSRYMCRKYRQKFRNVPLHVQKVHTKISKCPATRAESTKQNLKKRARLDSSHREGSFVNFMKSKFNSDCISSASTTLGNTCIDLTFTRNISVQTLPYVSYVSYHRPLLSRLMLSSEQEMCS